MENQEKVLPTHKWIIINDMNRELSPIGYGLQSPIYRPSKFTVDIIGQLLNVSKVTAMYEVYEDDHTLQVNLNNSNYRKSFEEIWAEQNPDTPFPWGKSVETVQVEQPVAPAPTPVVEPSSVQSEVQPPVDETPIGDESKVGVEGEQEPQTPASEVDTGDSTPPAIQGDTDGDLLTGGETSTVEENGESDSVVATTSSDPSDAETSDTETVAPAVNTETSGTVRNQPKYSGNQRRR